MSNRAAFLSDFGRDTKFVVGDAPFPHAGPDTLVVRNRAVATNPIDWTVKDLWPAFLYLQKPFILGIDTAGEVVEVGPNVTRFKAGDRVMAYCLTLDWHLKDRAYAAYQEYTLVNEGCAAHIPDALTFEQAAVVPLGCFSATAALFHKSQLALDLPTVPARPKNGKVIVVWGGASSVGTIAIQLASAAGYDVYTTCSPQNTEYLQRLGATRVFDYKDPNVVTKMVADISDKYVVGALAIHTGSAEVCVQVLSEARNAERKVVMISKPVASDSALPILLLKVVAWGLRNVILQRRVKLSFSDASSARNDGLGEYILHEYLPQAFASGDFVAAPQPIVVGSGLESIQGALELHQSGVSAAKPVISLP